MSKLQAILYKHCEDLTDVQHIKLMAALKQWAAQEANKALAEGMQRAKSRVLRRTEIPADAREPTRDAIVILGEEIADIIQRDIDALTAEKGSSDG